MVDAAPVEKPGEVDGMLHRVNHDLGTTVRDEGNELEELPPFATKCQASCLPGSLRLGYLHSLLLQMRCELISDFRLVSKTALDRFISCHPGHFIRRRSHC